MPEMLQPVGVPVKSLNFRTKILPHNLSPANVYEKRQSGKDTYTGGPAWSQSTSLGWKGGGEEERTATTASKQQPHPPLVKKFTFIPAAGVADPDHYAGYKLIIRIPWINNKLSSIRIIKILEPDQDHNSFNSIHYTNYRYRGVGTGTTEPCVEVGQMS